MSEAIVKAEREDVGWNWDWMRGGWREVQEETVRREREEEERRHHAGMNKQQGQGRKMMV